MSIKLAPCVLSDAMQGYPYVLNVDYVPSVIELMARPYRGGRYPPNNTAGGQLHGRYCTSNPADGSLPSAADADAAGAGVARNPAANSDCTAASNGDEGDEEGRAGGGGGGGYGVTGCVEWAAGDLTALGPLAPAGGEFDLVVDKVRRSAVDS